MSSYRKYRSRKSIYHPGISLNHPLTYNQKKGMIIQRDTNLPEPGHVYTRKELEKMYRILLNFHMITPELTTNVTSVSSDLSANQLNEYVLSYSLLKNSIAEALETSVGKIRQFQLQAITIRISNGNFPKVSYKWVVGESPFTVYSGTNNFSGINQYNVKLGTPILYKSIYSSDFVYIVCPQVKNGSSDQGFALVQWDQTFNQTAQSTHTDVFDLWENGVRSIPWALYDKNDKSSLDVHTEISIDMTGNTYSGRLELEFVAVYEE